MAVPLLLAILLSVTLTPPFGEAEARALTVTGAITIDVSVKVEGTPTTVIARITGLAGELPPQALVDRGGGIWGTIIRLTGREDVLIAFEYIDADGTTTISSSSKLTALGVDPAVIAPSLPTTPPPDEPGIDPFLIAGLAAALGALILFGVWAGAGIKESVKPTDWTYASTEAAKGPSGDEDEEPSSKAKDGGPGDDVDEEPSSETEDGGPGDDGDEVSE